MLIALTNVEVVSCFYKVNYRVMLFEILIHKKMGREKKKKSFTTSEYYVDRPRWNWKRIIFPHCYWISRVFRYG